MGPIELARIRSPRPAGPRTKPRPAPEAGKRALGHAGTRHAAAGGPSAEPGAQARIRVAGRAQGQQRCSGGGVPVGPVSASLAWQEMEIRVLGPFEIVTDDGQLMDVGGHLPQALLVVLALAEGRPVPADQLLDQVWRAEGLEGAQPRRAADPALR